MSTAQAKGEGALVTRTAIEEAYETIRDSVTHTPLQFDRYYLKNMIAKFI